MNDKKAIVLITHKREEKYLSGLHCFCYGEKVIGQYELFPHMAMPLSDDQAKALLPMLQDDYPSYALRYNEEFGIPGLKWLIVDYPSREVSGND